MKLIKSNIRILLVLLLASIYSANAETTSSIDLENQRLDPNSSFSDCMVLSGSSLPKSEDYESYELFFAAWLPMHRIQASTCEQLISDINPSVSNPPAVTTTSTTVVGF